MNRQPVGQKVTFSTLLLSGISFLFFTASCSGMPSPDQDSSLTAIQRIEKDLIPITKTGDTSIRQTIIERMKALGIQGVSVAVFDSGRIAWAKGYGLKDKEHALAVDTGTLFQAASISKPLATTAMFRLVEDHLLSLDEDVNIKLRSWKVPDNEYTTTKKVTLRRIVSHMSGLSVHGFRGYRPKDKLPTLTQILDGTPPANSPPVRVTVIPDTKEMYSGGGFTVMQLLMEETTGKPFAQIMQERVLGPVGMTQSTFALPLPGHMGPLAARGYDDKARLVDGGYHVYPEQAAAGLWTTPSDLARFMLSIGNAYRSNNGILQQATVQTMLTKVPGGSGQGFGVDGVGAALRFRHSGGNAGFSCYAVSFAETGRGVVVMTNSDNGTPLIRELIRAISREYGWPAL